MAVFEDEYFDILRKARTGLWMSGDELARKAGVTPAALKLMLAGEGEPDERALRPVASALGLDPEKLAALAFRPAPPATVKPTAPFVRIPLERAANAYVLGAPGGRKGVIVDPGDEEGRIAAAVETAGVEPAFILVTHDHSDHTGALDAVRRRWPVPVVRCEDGREIAAGTLRGRVRAITGHSPDSCVFIFESRGLAFTGDALFARSLGGAEPGEGYRTQLERVRGSVLSLPPETILAPGHGPLTTVADELRWNPFFP